MADSTDLAATILNPASIDINQPDEISYWTARLSVDETQLRRAVADVGVATDAIAVHLGAA